MVMPLVRGRVLPDSSVAVGPSVLMRTEATVPLTVPSSEVTVLPMTESARDSDEEVSRESSLVLVAMLCSTWEKEAS